MEKAALPRDGWQAAMLIALAALSDAWARRFQLIACRRASQPNPSVEAFRELARHGAPVPVTT